VNETTEATDRVPASDPIEPGEPVDRRRTIPLVPALVLALACGVLGAAIAIVIDRRSDDPSSVDIGFYDDMSTHHLQAIEMTQRYERHADIDGVLRSLAEEIEYFQSGDVRVMQDALSDWEEIGTPDVAMEWMGMNVPQDEQPGMASDDEMRQLNLASGQALDDLFSRIMIEHHAGGVAMADVAADRARLHSTRDLAAAMVRVQRREIDELNRRRVVIGLPVYEPTIDLSGGHDH
jgi:uncharacterized protein (DUF305 family)